MRKIAIVSTTYAHSLWSGLGRHTFYLAYALAKRNYDVSVFTFAPGGRSFKSHDGQVIITRIGIASGEGNSLPIESLDEWNAKINAELKRNDYEAIILTTCHGWDSVKDLQTKVLGFVPFVYGFTGWVKSIRPIEEQKMLRIESAYLAGCSELICHNSQFAEKVAQHANREVCVLPSCHLDLSEDTICHQEKVPNSLLFVGKLNKEKSIETVIRALIQVPKAVLTLCYPEVGKCYVPKIEKLAAQYNLSSRINCKGWLPGQDIKNLYAQSEIAVTTSFHEPYGYPVLDAMSFGSIPLVADWSGLSEYVSPEEIFSSIQDMANKMKSIFSKSPQAKQDMEAANLEKIKGIYSERIVTDQLEMLIRGVK